MNGGSSGLTEQLDDIFPKDAQFVLNWNPPQLYCAAEEEAHVILHTQEPPDTTLSPLWAIPIGYSRQAAFYDKHLAPHLILERVVYFDTLVSTMENTVDQAIQDAVAKRPLPKDTGTLMPEKIIKFRDIEFPRTQYHEVGVAESYKYTADYCHPIASTLALHPSSERWGSMLIWRSDGKLGRWAIADGVLRISQDVFADDQWKQQMLQNEDDGKKDILKQLADGATVLAVWEMKSLTEGTAQVMQEIVEMGQTHAKFPWKKCNITICDHRFWEDMEEFRESYDAGFDPRSPPWTLPVVSSTCTADSRSTARRKNLRSTSARGETTAMLSYEEPSMSPVEDGEVVRKKRRRDDSDAPEYEQPLPKKSKADLMDESYELPRGAREGVDAQSFLQQTWAQAVRNKCTIMVLHSGNHEIIGIRHRETQTLYISHLIEPHSCSNPAYGKIQVGLYIGAIQETIDRARQDIEAREKSSPDGQTRFAKRSEVSGLKVKRQGGHEGNAKDHASGKEIDDQALLANAARQNHLCLRFFYDIYDSPRPATFRRVSDKRKGAAGPAEPLTPFLSPGHETTPPSASERNEPSIHITVHSELSPGSTGIVHIGTMAVGPSGPTAKVAVKLAFSWDEKSQLMYEHRVYSHLHSKGVQGIPRDIGLFVDEEPLLGSEGPHALVMTYAGVSFFRRHELASDSVKDSLLGTLESIHRANILHGDIRLPNLCITPSGEAIVINFSRATESRSRREKAQEIRVLSYILGMDSPAKAAAKDVEKPVVRRSARIKELERKSKVVGPKVEQAKRGKSTAENKSG